MAQTGYTPISLYYTTTAAAVPTAGNLVAGELALNTNDGKLYYKNSSGVVTLLAGATSGPAGGSTTQVQYNNAGVLAGITGATTNGTALTLVAPVLGTPASGTVTNLTGTASININGTVGATTPAAGAFTTVSSKQTSGGTTALTIKSFDASGGNQPLGVFQRSDAAVSIELGYDGTTGNSHIGTTTAHDFEIWRGGSVKATATSTGLAVTGTLSSTLDATIYGVTVGRGAGAVSTNTAVGASALAGANTGVDNHAFGYQALLTNTTGSFSTAFGSGSLKVSNANQNAAFGHNTLFGNTSGANNTAIGSLALNANTTASNNTAVGKSSLPANTTGASNTAVGTEALQANTTASNNTAVGYQAGYTNTTGGDNTFLGKGAGYGSANGYNGNTAIGFGAGGLLGAGGNYNTFIGVGSGGAVTTGASNTIVGGYSGNQGGLDIRTASNYIVLSDGAGNPRGWFDGSGYFHSVGFYNITTASAANLNIDTDYVVRRSTSALKYKQDIRDLEEIDINLLRPVRYKSKCESDDQTKDHLGLIADEAADAGFEELITRGADGEVEGFQYERLTVVLLKSLQTLKTEFDAYKSTHP